MPRRGRSGALTQSENVVNKEIKWGYLRPAWFLFLSHANIPIKLAKKIMAHSDKVGMGATAISTATVAVAVLLAGLTSLSADVVTVTTVEPLAGAMKDTEQTIDAPAAKLACGLVGVQLTVAPAGKPVTAQVALSAATVVLVLVQVAVPVTVAPGSAVELKPLMLACTSAVGTFTATVVVAVLLVESLSLFAEVVTVMTVDPLAGAV